jgi:uncharacterized protein YecT (DUF1311 family)
MKKCVVGITITVLVFTAGLAFAAGECDKYKTTYDRTYCYGKLFIESDRELNIVYNQLKGMLKGDTRARLVEAQRDWIVYRDNSCERRPGQIDVVCNYEVNRVRAEYLRDRLRECKTGNCRNNMIIMKNWK